jgi:hypothetical protein
VHLYDSVRTNHIAIKIITGKIPYHYLENDAQVLCQVCRGVKPLQQTTVVVDQYWDFLSRCWSDAPDSRPNIGDVSVEVKIFYRRCIEDPGRLEVGQSFLAGDDDGSCKRCPKLANRLKNLRGGAIILRIFGGFMRDAK